MVLRPGDDLGPSGAGGDQDDGDQQPPVQPAGPRQGENGSRFFNVEGAKKERYANYGVLVFDLPTGGDHAGDVERLNLRPVQSVARFSLDGKVRFFLAEPSDRADDPLAKLKFQAGSPGGVARHAFKALHPLGWGTFTKVKIGRVDTFEFKADEADAVTCRNGLSVAGRSESSPCRRTRRSRRPISGRGPSRKRIGRG